MANAARQRMTVDLGALAPALKAHAMARHLTVAQAARLALVAAFVNSPLDARVEPEGELDSAEGRSVKLTIRLRRGVAERLSARARERGLSHGAYVTTLIDGTPAPLLAMVNALTASTDQLAVVSADANEVIRLLRKDSLPSEQELGHFVRSIVDGTRKHLELASRVVAQLRPARTCPIQRPRTSVAAQQSSK